MISNATVSVLKLFTVCSISLNWFLHSIINLFQLKLKLLSLVLWVLLLLLLFMSFSILFSWWKSRFSCRCLKKSRLKIELGDVVAAAQLAAFGAGVGGPRRLFKRDTCDDQRTVYTGGVLVIAWTLFTKKEIKSKLEWWEKWRFNFVSTYRTTTVLNFHGIVNILCLSRGQNKCNWAPAWYWSSSAFEYSCMDIFQAAQERLCSDKIWNDIFERRGKYYLHPITKKMTFRNDSLQ